VIVLVTGGSSGIGLATVKRLVAQGHQVFSASRQPARAALPDGVTPIAFDVAVPRQAGAVVDEVVRAAGRIDVLVNNAAASMTHPLEETTDEDAHHLLEVNVFGPMRLARAVIPAMRAQGSGRIINVTSMNDTVPAPFSGWYSASKAALATLSYVLRAELRAQGIHVTVVAPGFFLTDMAKSLSADPPPSNSLHADTLRRLHDENLERLSSAGDPDDVAAAIEACLDEPEPPARMIVGLDAVGFESLIRGSSAEDLAAMLVDYVAQLAAR
jgi:NAD(P)-dependent dehydrogenase (short-subunit alcohol dehydrogenase family)